MAHNRERLIFGALLRKIFLHNLLSVDNNAMAQRRAGWKQRVEAALGKGDSRRKNHPANGCAQALYA